MPKIAMVFIHVYHSKAWLVDDYRDTALETNITTTVTGTATWNPLFEPDSVTGAAIWNPFFEPDPRMGTPRIGGNPFSRPPDSSGRQGEFLVQCTRGEWCLVSCADVVLVDGVVVDT